MFHIPNTAAGTAARITMMRIRLRSMASRTWEPLRVTVPGTWRKVSKASTVECSQYNLPPFSKILFIILSHFLKHQVYALCNHILDIVLARIDELAGCEIFRKNLIDAELLHLVNVTGKAGLGQEDREDVHRKHL